MSDILTDTSPAAMAEAVEANMAALSGEIFPAWDRVESYRGDDLTWTQTDITFPMFNALMRARLTPETADAAIEAAMARSRAHGGVPLMWWAGAGQQPADLEERLAEHGWSYDGDPTPGMAVELDQLNEAITFPEGLVIEQVADRATLDTYGDVMSTAFGLPLEIGRLFADAFTATGLQPDAAMRQYVARLNGEIVATSALALASGVAGIYNVGTLAGARGQGIGAIITLHPLIVARELGYRVGTLKSSEMGFSVYKRLGFEQVCEFHNYFWMPED